MPPGRVRPVGESSIGPSGVNAPPLQFIRTMKAWVAQYYPLDTINGALTQAEILGIFGRPVLAQLRGRSYPVSAAGATDPCLPSEHARKPQMRTHRATRFAQCFVPPAHTPRSSVVWAKRLHHANRSGTIIFGNLLLGRLASSRHRATER